MTNVALIGSDAARFGVARQKLDRVFSGQQREAGVVFDGPLGQLRRGRVAQLDVHLVAHVGDGGAVVVLDLADEIDQRVLGAAGLASASSLPGIFTTSGTKYSARFNWK